MRMRACACPCLRAPSACVSAGMARVCACALATRPMGLQSVGPLATRGLAGCQGPAGPVMHRFGAARLEGRGGLCGPHGYVGSTGLFCGPWRAYSGPWRAIGAGLAGWAGAAAGAMPIFPVRNHSAVSAYSTRAYGLAYGLTYDLARAGPALSVGLSTVPNVLLSIYRIMKPC